MAAWEHLANFSLVGVTLLGTLELVPEVSIDYPLILLGSLECSRAESTNSGSPVAMLPGLEAHLLHPTGDGPSGYGVLKTVAPGLASCGAEYLCFEMAHCPSGCFPCLRNRALLSHWFCLPVASPVCQLWIAQERQSHFRKVYLTFCEQTYYQGLAVPVPEWSQC